MVVVADKAGKLQVVLDMRAMAGQNVAIDHILDQTMRVAAYVGQPKAAINFVYSGQNLSVFLGGKKLYNEMNPQIPNNSAGLIVASKWNEQEQAFVGNATKNPNFNQDGPLEIGTGRIGAMYDRPQGFHLYKHIQQGALNDIIFGCEQALAAANIATFGLLTKTQSPVQTPGK
jgi:hypothetical protein